MNKIWLIASLYVTLQMPVLAADVELDRDLMQAIEDTNKSLASNIALENAKGSASDAKDLTGMFELVVDHFVKKGGAENAVELATKSKSLTLEITNFVAEKKYEDASNSATELSRACKSCHTFYKKE